MFVIFLIFVKIAAVVSNSIDMRNACGEGKIAKSWRETHETCPCCGLDFRVEGGFYLGSIYLNYGIIGLLFLGVGLPLVWFEYVSPAAATAVGVLIGIPLSLWFWRYARSLWLSFGYYVDQDVRVGKHMAMPTKPQGEQSEDGFECVCPFCHAHARIEESRRNSWSACDVCGEQILLMPVGKSALQ